MIFGVDFAASVVSLTFTTTSGDAKYRDAVGGASGRRHSSG